MIRPLLRSIAFVVSASLVLLVAPGADAITSNGTIDGNDHPYVGLMVVDWQRDGVLRPFCSGSLIAPTVYLTAAHCTAYLESVGVPNDEVWVTFDPAYTESSALIRGTWYTHPEWKNWQQISDAHDLAVIVLDTAVTSITPAQLPEAGLLDRLAREGTLKDETFTIVGYGSEEKPRGSLQAEFPNDYTREWAVASFNSLNKSWLRLSQNQARGDGGACYGDSGGPNLLGTTDVIVATTSTGDGPCYSTNVAYRVDTESARAFLDDFVTVP